MTFAKLGFMVVCVAGSCSNTTTTETVSCEYGIGPEDAASPGDIAVCRDWTGPSDQIAALRNECASAQGPLDAGVDGLALVTVFSTGPCTHVQAVGGCRSAVGAIMQTDWYYGGVDPSSVISGTKDICASSGATFVSP